MYRPNINLPEHAKVGWRNLMNLMSTRKHTNAHRERGGESDA